MGALRPSIRLQSYSPRFKFQIHLETLKTSSLGAMPQTNWMGTSRKESLPGSLGDSSEKSGWWRCGWRTQMWMDNVTQGWVGIRAGDWVHQGTACPCVDGDLWQEQKERVEVGMGVQAAFSEGRRLEALAQRGRISRFKKEKEKLTTKMSGYCLQGTWRQVGNKAAGEWRDQWTSFFWLQWQGSPSC